MFQNVGPPPWQSNHFPYFCFRKTGKSHFLHLHFEKLPNPQIAIICPNTLACLGLADIIRRMMPGAETCIFSRFAELANFPEAENFFHYFVSTEELLNGATYFIRRQHKTIVLIHGDDHSHLPQGFHTLNLHQSEKELVKTILALAHRSHHAHGMEPEAVRVARKNNSSTREPLLTPRERDVLKGIVEGLLNKEIAERMGVSPATVITHRKNLTEKLGTRSVSSLTIYAVAHGIVLPEDI